MPTFEGCMTEFTILIQYERWSLIIMKEQIDKMCHKSLRTRNLWQSILILQNFSPLQTMMMNTSLRRVSPILFRQCCSRHKSSPTVYLASMSILSKKKEQNHTIVKTNYFHPLLLNKKFSMSPTFFSLEVSWIHSTYI